jgi:DNA-directed RNA polymerase III subunit RPC3
LRLVQHHTTPEGFSTYQANLCQAYNLLRISKTVSLARKLHGSTAAQVITQLCSVGFSTCSDLISAVESETHAQNDAGHTNGGDVTREKIFSAIKSLAEDEFLVQVRPAQLQIPSDARQDADDHIIRNPPATADMKLKGKKAQDQHQELVSAELEQRLDAYLPLQTLSTALDGAHVQLNGDETTQPEDLYIGVSYAKAVKETWNKVLVGQVKRKFGEKHSKVSAALFRGIDVFTLGSSRTSQRQIVSLSRVAQAYSRSNQYHEDGTALHMNGWHHDEQMTNGFAETNGDDINDEIVQSLNAIAEGPYNFVQDSGDGTFNVDHVRLRNFLVRHEIINIARARIGTFGVRMMRILMDKGRMDERMLQERGLFEVKQMRRLLQKLHAEGFIELQEVPKDQQRQPIRTIFLWFYDEERARKLLLEEVYKSMTRLYQRLQYEREQMNVTLEKIEKEDCEGSEVEVLRLGQAEMVALGQLRMKEKWLMGEIMRLDDTVALLRDL